MRVCSSCGRQNPDDRDFCECGEYLRWEPTGFMPSVDASQVTAAPPPPAPASPEPVPPPPGPPAPAAGPPPPPPTAAPPPPPPQPPLPAPVAPAPPARSHPTTAINAAVPAPPAAPAAPAEAAIASISLRVPEVDGTPGDTVAVGVDPGGRARVLALVRNASGIVDNYALEVTGIPEDWYTVSPNPVYLVPFGSAGAYEQEVDIQLHPPRSPEAHARIWNLEVVAHSAAYQRPAASAPLVLGIQPYEEFEPRLKPEKASGRRRASYDVAVRNKANSPVLVMLGIEDAEAILRGDFKERSLEVPAGETRTTRLDVTPPRPIYVGRPVEHRFEVLARTGEEGQALLEQAAGGDGGGGPDVKGLAGKHVKGQGPRVRIGPGGVKVQEPVAKVRKPTVPQKSFGLEDLKKPSGAAAAPQWTAPLLPTQAVFRQRPFVPRWLLLLLLLLILAGILLYLLLPRTVTVPNVVGREVFAATKALNEVELAVNPVIDQKVSAKPPGTVLSQSLDAGDKVKKNRVVTLVQAVGSGDVRVPDVVGRTFADGSKRIDRAKLQVGAVNPPPPEPALKIKSTIPAAGEVVKEGKAVQVFLAPKKTGGGGGDDEGGGEQGSGGGGGGAAAAAVALPAVTGGSAEKAAAALAGAGIVPLVKSQFTDEAPAGQVFRTEPPPGEEVRPGDEVTLFVSLGIPRVAFDDDEDVILADGIDGKRVEDIAGGSERQLQPAFNAAGSALLFVSDGQVQLANRRRPDATPKALTSADEWRLPTFAPTPSADVIAVLRLLEATESGQGAELCVGRLTRRGVDPECLELPDGVDGFGTNVLRWSPDGKALFVEGVTAGEGPVGIVRYTSGVPYSPDADDWRRGRVVTDTGEPGKRAIDLAISPDGKSMAVVANFDQPRDMVYVTKPDDFDLAKAKRLPLQACTVGWRPDSLELVVVQADDCSGPGRILRAEVADPRNTFTLAQRGNAPVYAPSPPDTGDAG